MSIRVVFFTSFVPKINRVNRAVCRKDGFHWYEHSTYTWFKRPSRIRLWFSKIISKIQFWFRKVISKLTLMAWHP